MGEEVRHWFELAVELPHGSRAGFLETNCSDESVRAEVLSLLEYDSGEDGRVPEVVVPAAVVEEAMDAILERSSPPAPARRVGPFELGRLLGSGGMGLVYEAHRDDGQVRQRVAVKFAQVPHSAGEEVRRRTHRRFLRERQMLASLGHPYIAGLIDAGATADGTPYAVLEQVDGIPVDQYCDAHDADDSQRIALVLKLCEAVQFAHRNLIVHSDIKPANVLVTAGGIPKLIDFGIASDLNEEATLTGTPAFTPGYASPEQALGNAATVATDVYGIGAVLYRLLTGSKPREVTNQPLHQVLQSISGEEVIRPSSIRPDLKGDLENILLKALQRDPQRRYGSVPELSDDLNRFLLRRPVRATPDSVWYRMRRFARRHWMPLAAASAVAAALIGATAVALHQREEALLRAVETRRLADRLLFEVHDEIGGLVGGSKAREKLGAIAVQYLESLGRDFRRDPELAWELLNAYSRLAQSRGGGASSVGDTRSALFSAAKTLELGSVVEESEPGQTRLDSLFTAYANLVPIFEEAGRPEQRRQAIDRMLRLAPRLQPLREAQSFKELARYYDSIGKPQEAGDAIGRSLRILRELSASASAPAAAKAEFVTALVSSGMSMGRAGNFQGAIASFNEAIVLAERNSASMPHLARSARQLYWSHIALGDVLGSPVRFSLGRAAEAVQHYRKAGLIAERLLQGDSGNDAAKLDLARALSREGAALAALSPSQSLDLMLRSHSLTLEASPRNHAGLVSRFDYLTSLVEARARLGQVERARMHLAEARAVLAQLRLNGVQASERNLLRADALRLFAAGRQSEALARAQRHLALLPRETNPVLSENFEKVQLLGRIRTYAAGLDPAACASAREALARTWRDLKASHPHSAFVAAQAERARSIDSQSCAVRPRPSPGLPAE